MASDAGDWAEFCKLVCGSTASRKEQTLSLAKVWIDKPNIYGEPTGLKTFGVLYEGESTVSRPREWTIKKKGPSGLMVFC